MNKLDLEHKLLKGSPIDFCGIPLYSVSLGEMVDFEYGYSVFNKILTICTLDKSKFDVITISDGNIFEGSAFWYFYFTVTNELKSQKPSFDYDGKNVFLHQILTSFFSTLFHEDIEFSHDYGFVIGKVNQLALNDSNFDKFVELLKLRFSINDVDKIDEDNPADEFTKSLIEKRNRARQRLKDAKKNDNDSDLTLSDLISIFSESEHLSPTYVYDNYDIYQFNDQFSRLRIISDYHVGVQSLLAGAKKEDVNLQYWITKIKTLKS